jgi:hypothetical protein
VKRDAAEADVSWSAAISGGALGLLSVAWTSWLSGDQPRAKVAAAVSLALAAAGLVAGVLEAWLRGRQA